MLYISLKTIILYSLVEMFFLKGLMTFWSLLQASLKHTSLKHSRFRIVHVIRGYAGLKPGPCGGRHREHTYHQGNVYLSLRTTSIGIKRVLDVTHWSTWCLFFYLFFQITSPTQTFTSTLPPRWKKTVSWTEPQTTFTALFDLISVLFYVEQNTFEAGQSFCLCQPYMIAIYWASAQGGCNGIPNKCDETLMSSGNPMGFTHC